MVSTSVVFAQPQEPQPRVLPPGYRVETIPTPEGVEMEVGGLAFEPGGSLLVTTRFGQIWRYKAGQWSLFAEGLHEPLGAWVDPKNGDVFVAQRPELTKLVDRDKDGKADEFTTVSAGWGYSGNYHEYAFGPVRDKAGNFYVTLNLSHSTSRSVRGSEMGSAALFRGWCVQITPDGKLVPIASGMRSPAGLGISKDDEIFYTDNQGGFMATSPIHHVKPGRFFGNPSSLFDDPKLKDKDINAIPLEELDPMRSPPAVWIPHGELANSPGEPVFDYTQGKFGPFTGQMFLGDQTKSNILRVFLEKVGGEYQGAVFNFIEPLNSGVVRCAFAPDGSLYAGMTDRGWGAVGGRHYALQRIVYDGKTTPFEIYSISLTKKGFDLSFTHPVNREAAGKIENYAIRHWGYLYRPEYGSPKVGDTVVKPTAVTVSPDRKSVSLELPLVKGHVYMFRLPALTAADGAKLANPVGYYTVSRLRE